MKNMFKGMMVLPLLACAAISHANDENTIPSIAQQPTFTGCPIKGINVVDAFKQTVTKEELRTLIKKYPQAAPEWINFIGKGHLDLRAFLNAEYDAIMSEKDTIDSEVSISDAAVDATVSDIAEHQATVDTPSFEQTVFDVSTEENTAQATQQETANNNDDKQ
jgi:hypothetical protein